MYLIVKRDQSYLALTPKYLIDEETGFIKIKDKNGRVWYLRQIIQLTPEKVVAIDAYGNIVAFEPDPSLFKKPEIAPPQIQKQEAASSNNVESK